MKRFYRHRISDKWAIGWDLRNGALLQFTRTEPYKPHRYRVINLWVFAFRRSENNISNTVLRTHINLGWKQGFAWIWCI